MTIRAVSVLADTDEIFTILFLLLLTAPPKIPVNQEIFQDIDKLVVFMSWLKVSKIINIPKSTNK